MKRNHQELAGDRGGRDRRGYGNLDAKVKSLTGEDGIQDAGDDELLAALGYKVRSSSMADVAQKLERLEMAMAVAGNGGSVPSALHAGNGGNDDGNSSLLMHLVSDSVHYNPSDLNSWLENMLSELNVPPPPSLPPSDPSPEDLTSIIPVTKRLKSSPPQPPPMSVVVVETDSQEAGIRLVHTLLACAEAVQQEKLPLAENLVNQITVLAMSQSGPMRKVATYFAEALARRIRHTSSSPASPQLPPSSDLDLLSSHFYEACPYLKFAHFTANQAILEAFSGKSRVHVIDLGIKQGMQWPALMQALALRPGGPPFFRLTGIGPPQPDNSDALQDVGSQLAQLAETIHVDFEYRCFAVSSLSDLVPHMFDMSDTDAVAVNSVLEFHGVLPQPGAIEKVLGTIKSMRPTILTVAEQEANHNVPVFLDRFTEALHYYSSMFDSLEGEGNGMVAATDPRDRAMTEVFLGRQIFDVVACEGVDRKERHEKVEKWRERIVGAGFEMAPLGSNAFKQASMLLELFAGGDGYRVEEKDGCFMLGWHTRPIISASAWKPARR